MNEEHLAPDVQQRVKALYRYTGALECGDIDTVAAVLAETGHDPALERMILEVNETYQSEDRAAARPADVELAQEIMREVIPASSAGRIAADGRLLEEEAVPGGSVASERSGAPNSLPVWKATRQVAQSKKAAPGKRRQYRRSWAAAVAAAGLVALLVLTGATGLAQQFLSLFQPKQFQPVTVDPQAFQLRPLPEFQDFGDLQFQPNSFKFDRHLSQAQARQYVTFPVLLPASLPGNVGHTPVYDGIGAGQGTFTFRSAKVHAYLARTGHDTVQIPANLDGATFTVSASASIEMHYSNPKIGLLVIVEAPSPTVRSTGSASLEQLRTFLLSLPGLPPQLVTQLKQIDLNSGTVPLPVPPEMTSRSVTVHGTSGVLVLNDGSSSLGDLPIGRLVLWQSHGIIYAVGATGKDTTQLLDTANSLR